MSDDIKINRWHETITPRDTSKPWTLGSGGSWDMKEVQPIPDEMMTELAQRYHYAGTPWNCRSMPLTSSDREYMFMLYYSMQGLIARMRIAEKDAADLRAALAAKTADDDAQGRAFTAIRLRAVCDLLGLDKAVPDKDDELLGCAFSVLGMVRRKIEELKSVAIGFTNLAPAMAVEPAVVAWLHDDPDRIDVIADKAKLVWIKVRKTQVERYTIPLGRIVPDATVAVPTDEEIANIAVHIRPDDYMATNGSDSVDYLRYDGAVVRAFLATAPAVQQGGDSNAVLEEAAKRCEGLIANAEDWDSSNWDQCADRCAFIIRSLKTQPVVAHPLMDGKSAFVAAYMKHLRENTHDGRQWLNDKRDANEAWDKIPGVMWRTAIAATKGAGKP